jgi:crossover junction endodeoxyribonuclease RuvC
MEGSEMIVLGVDPGKDGAIAVIREEVKSITFHDIPTLFTGVGGKRDYDVHEMASIMRTIGEPQQMQVILERQQAMPPHMQGRTQGVATSFQIGVGYGVWLGLLGALGIPFLTVLPATWKKVMLSDMPKGKEASRAKAKQMFPQAAEDLKLVKHHNRAEALLICEFGRRELARQR